MLTGSSSSSTTSVFRTSLLVSSSGLFESSSHEATIRIFKIFSVPWGLGKEATWGAAGHIRSREVLPAQPAPRSAPGRAGRPCQRCERPTPTPGHFPGFPQESESSCSLPGDVTHCRPLWASSESAGTSPLSHVDYSRHSPGMRKRGIVRCQQVAPGLCGEE